MGWDLPWYSAQPSLDTLLTGRPVGLFLLVCCLRQDDKVYETYPVHGVWSSGVFGLGVGRWAVRHWPGGRPWVRRKAVANANSLV